MTAIRMILVSATALALLASTGAHAVTPKQRSRIDAMATFLHADGPKRTLQRYFHFEDPAEGTPVGMGYALVETGDPSAVQVGVAVLEVSDGGVTEDLTSSLAIALAKKPTVVLPYFTQLDRSIRRRICIPFLPLDAPNADASAKVALARAERALKTVNDPALDAGKDACLEEVRNYRAAMRANAQAGAAR